MNIHQVEWAEAHDWCRFAHEEEDGSWTVCVETVLVDTVTGQSYIERTSFRDYQELRAWAGY